MLRISVSDFKGWLECPHRAVWRHRLGKWIPPSDAMRTGLVFHKALEYWTRGEQFGGMEAAKTLQQVAPKNLKQATSLVAALNAFPRPEWTCRGVEVPLAMKMPWTHTAEEDFELVGRLDGIIETSDGRLWSLQGKTIASAKPIAQEVERVAHSFHELVYHKLAAVSGMDLAGTCVVVGVKLSQKARDAGQAEILLDWVERDSALVESFWPALEGKLRECAADFAKAEADGPLFKNTESCLGLFGNSECPLFSSCHQGANLKQHAAMNFTFSLEDRYGDLDSNDDD